jgi:hypothetical protein
MRALRVQNWRKLEPRIVDDWLMRERGHDRYEISRERERAVCGRWEVYKQRRCEKEAKSDLAATLSAQRLQSFSDHYLRPDKSLTTKLTNLNLKLAYNSPSTPNSIVSSQECSWESGRLRIHWTRPICPSKSESKNLTRISSHTDVY